MFGKVLEKWLNPYEIASARKTKKSEFQMGFEPGVVDSNPIWNSDFPFRTDDKILLIILNHYYVFDILGI